MQHRAYQVWVNEQPEAVKDLQCSFCPINLIIFILTILLSCQYAFEWESKGYKTTTTTMGMTNNPGAAHGSLSYMSYQHECKKLRTNDIINTAITCNKKMKSKLSPRCHFN